MKFLNRFVSFKKLSQITLTIDANGSLTINQLNEIFKILNLISFDNILVLIEQPFPDDWNIYKKINYNLLKNIVLDESIVNLKTIKQASDLGLYGIKIKSCKFGSYLKLINAAEYARINKLKCSIGNGFATGISNIHEIAAVLLKKELFQKVLRVLDLAEF